MSDDAAMGDIARWLEARPGRISAFVPGLDRSSRPAVWVVVDASRTCGAGDQEIGAFDSLDAVRSWVGSRAGMSLADLRFEHPTWLAVMATPECGGRDVVMGLESANAYFTDAGERWASGFMADGWVYVDERATALYRAFPEPRPNGQSYALATDWADLSPWLHGQWREGFRVHHLAHAGGSFQIVMNRFADDRPGQLTLRQDDPDPPLDEIEDYWAEGYRITDVAYSRLDGWVIVMTEIL